MGTPEYNKAYYEKNAEKLRATERARYHANRERNVQRMRARYHANPKKARARRYEWVAENRESVLADFQKRNREHKAFLNDLKRGPCLDCGEKFPLVCMEFDHVKPGKRYNPAGMSNHSREAVLREIALCEIVCCNCHRVRSAKRKPSTKRWTQPSMFRKFVAFRAWMADLKKAPCADCKRCFQPPAMDFDHVRGKKASGLSQMWSWSREKVLAEIAKCDLVCANCHRIRTETRAGRPVTMAAA